MSVTDSRGEVALVEALGNIGDFVGGIGVVATLIYLAVQIRQNTRAMRMATRQEIVAGAREWNRLLLDPQVSAAYELGLQAYPEVEAEAHARFRSVMHDLTLFMQGAFAMWESGALEDETYNAYLEFFASHLVTPGGAAWWEIARSIYLSRMVESIDDRLQREGLRSRVEPAGGPRVPTESSV